MPHESRIPIHYIKRHKFWGGRVNSLLPQAGYYRSTLFVEVNRGGGGVERGQGKCFLANARGGRYIPRPSHFPLTHMGEPL